MAVRNKTVDLVELTPKEAHQVHHVDPLIKQDTTTSGLPPSPPVGLVEGHQLRLAIEAPQTDHRAKLPAFEDRQAILDRVVVSVVEPVHQPEVRMSLLHLDDALHVVRIASRWLLTEYVQTSLEACNRHRRCKIVRKADDQSIEFLP